VAVALAGPFANLHNHASIPPLCFLQAGCPSYCPTNSVIALKANIQSYALLNAFSAFMLVGWQEGHLACKKLE